MAGIEGRVVTDVRTTRLVSGIAPLLAFAVMTAAMDVYGGNRLQVLSPQSLAAISFTLTAAFFLTLEMARRGVTAFRLIRSHTYDVVAINVTTAVTWLSTLYALKYLEPAVVNVVGLALGPVIIALAGPVLRRGSTVLATEVVVSLGICVLLGVLVWGSFTGKTGIGQVGTDRALLGVIFAVVCAIGSSANIIYMKRLSEAGHHPQAVLAIRFFLIVLVAWLLTAMTDHQDLAAAVVPGAVVAVIGIGLPIYVLQIGIRHTEPITTSLLVSLSPLFAFLMQLLDGRLQPSVLTMMGIVGVVALVAVGTVARSLMDSRSRAPAVATTVHSGAGVGAGRK